MVQRPEEQTHRGILAWWARNSVAANLLMMIALIGGVIGFFSMQRENNPAATFPGATISMSWPGASPQDVEEQIIVRIEEALSDLDGVEEITATASEGSARVWVEGKSSVDKDWFVDEIERRVNTVNNLPRDAYRPIVSQWMNQDQIAGFALHGDIDRRELQRIAREIRDEVSTTVPEVSLVDIMGVLPEEVAIEVSEANMRRYGITFSEIARAIANSSINTSAGSVRTDLGDVRITARELADTREEFENIVVRQTPEGGTIRVGDVATVIDNLADANLNATFNGQQMVIIAVRSTGNSDIITVSNGLKAYMERKNEELPESVQLSEWWDGADQFNSQLTVIGNSALMGLGLVLLVLILFLRPIVAFWVTVGIAVAFAGAFMVLPMLGITLNFLSLFAFLIVIGVVVDDAIIVVENTERIMVEGGEPPRVAVRKAMRQISGAIVGITLVLTAVFLPLAFMSGSVGVIYQQFSVSMAVSILFSGFLALSLTPALCATLLKQVTHSSEHRREVRRGLLGVSDRFFNWFNHSFDRTTVRYENGIRRVISAPMRYMAVFVAIVVVLVFLFLRLPTSFLPVEDQGSLLVDIQLPANASANRTAAVSRQIENYYLGPPEVREKIEQAEAAGDQERAEQLRSQLSITQQATTKEVVINGFSFSGTGPNAGISFVILRDWEERNEQQSAQAIADRGIAQLLANSGIKDGTVLSIVPPAIQGLGTSNGFEFRLQDRSGQGYSALKRASDELMAKARASGKINPQSLRVTALPDAAQLEVCLLYTI